MLGSERKVEQKDTTTTHTNKIMVMEKVIHSLFKTNNLLLSVLNLEYSYLDIMEQHEGPATLQQPQQRGGVLYITDPPPTLDFGIDCMHYETGAKFRGVSMVPKGLHFVYHSTGMGSRQGFFLYFEKDAVVVKSWDNKNEDISAQLLLPEASLQSLLYSINCGQEDQYLGPYPLQQHSSWLNLSNFMTVSTLQRAGLDLHTPIYPGDAEDIPAELLSEQNKQAVTSYFPDQARVAQFCDIKLLEENVRKTITTSTSLDSTAKALELSQLYLDNSTLLENVVSQYFDSSWEELLAEVQLSFMLFMLIFSFPALEQWKALVNLICKSERVLISQPNFTSCFIRLFYEQLQYSPDDFFETEISSDNFLKPALSNLFESLDSQPLSNSLDAMRKRLFVFVQKKFNLYVDGGEENAASGGAAAGGGINLNMCEGTKFNLMEEDMPVVVLPEDMQLSSSSSSSGGTKGVSFADDCSGQGGRQHSDEDADNSAGRVRGKWDEIDAALGLSAGIMQVDGGGGGGGDDNDDDVTDSSGRMQVDSEVDLLPNQNINPNVDGKKDSSREDSEGGIGAGDSVGSSLALQASMFSWRYPLLFDEMTRNNTMKQSQSQSVSSAFCGQEDLTMTAMRVIETTPSSPESSSKRQLKEEGSSISSDSPSSSLHANTNTIPTRTNNTDSNNTSSKTATGDGDEPKPDPALRSEAMRFVRDEISLW